MAGISGVEAVWAHLLISNMLYLGMRPGVTPSVCGVCVTICIYPAAIFRVF